MTPSANLLVELRANTAVDLIQVPVSKSNVPNRAVSVKERVVYDASRACLGHPNRLISVVILRSHLNVIFLASLEELVELLDLLDEVLVV